MHDWYLEEREHVAERDSDRPPKLRKLSVIVPVYNERNTVVEILRRMRAVELPDGIEREIIVVDDGSRDGTRDVLAPARRQHRAHRRCTRRTAERARRCAAGSRTATGDYVLIQDADLEYDPDDWPQAASRRCCAGTARVVYGSRFTGERRNMLLLHWIGNRLLSLVTNVLYNTTLSDMETCYKLVDRKLLVDLGLRSDHFDIEPEITAKILKRKIRIYEVPISYMGREFDEGKKITWRDGFAALWTLVKFRFGD